MTTGSAARPLEGQVAFVTGASRGIGRAVATHLAALGADVAAGGRDLDALATVVEEVDALGVRGFGLRFEVTDTPSLPALVAEIESALGPIDILVNNAGVNRLRLALEVTEDDWDFVLGTNLRGAFFVAQAVGRGMVERGRGRIVNVASMAAFKAVPERSAYNSSKAALVHLTRTLAVEWGPSGVRVNAVCPTFIETDLAASWLGRPGVRKGIEAGIPIRRLPTVDDVAAAVGYLVGPGAAAINGVALPVDGGFGVT